jgi:hypothetical protein
MTKIPKAFPHAEGKAYQHRGAAFSPIYYRQRRNGQEQYSHYGQPNPFHDARVYAQKFKERCGNIRMFRKMGTTTGTDGSDKLRPLLSSEANKTPIKAQQAWCSSTKTEAGQTPTSYCGALPSPPMSK